MKKASDPRHQARRLATGYIYSELSSTHKPQPETVPDLLDALQQELEIPNYSKELFDKILTRFHNNKEELLKRIAANSPDWEVNKMYKTDLAILLIATAEIEMEDAPIKVVIDEAVELAKEFGESDSRKFINGILSGIVKNGKFTGA